VFSVNIVTLLGLGLAIDYALFMVSRFREELPKAEGDVETALRATMTTAGRTVAFSGLTVGISLGSLLIFPQVFLRSMGFGGMAAVLVAMVGALTVLPALLAVLGHRVNALSIRPFLRRIARRPAPAPVRLTFIVGSVPQRSTCAASRAAPVGVHISYGAGPAHTGADTAESNSSTAGAGTGIRPCSLRTTPLPSVTRPAPRLVRSSACRPAQTPTMSAIASSAPTSWKRTCSAATRWTRASAAASLANTSSALVRTASSSLALMSRSRTSGQVRVIVLRGALTCTLVAPSPPRVTDSTDSAMGSTATVSTASWRVASGTPASTTAPSSMSPLAPAVQSSQPITWPTPLPSPPRLRCGGLPGRRTRPHRTRCRCWTPRFRGRRS
ncbi:MAG: hypothetical protein DLM59_13040, partial [Pseudonocardiales bacterium]